MNPEKRNIVSTNTQKFGVAAIVDEKQLKRLREKYPDSIIQVSKVMTICPFGWMAFGLIGWGLFLASIAVMYFRYYLKRHRNRNRYRW